MSEIYSRNVFSIPIVQCLLLIFICMELTVSYFFQVNINSFIYSLMLYFYVHLLCLNMICSCHDTRSFLRRCMLTKLYRFEMQELYCKILNFQSQRAHYNYFCKVILSLEHFENFDNFAVPMVTAAILNIPKSNCK